MIIWPDNDDAGFAYASHVTQQLKLLDSDVLWVDIEKLSLPAKGDCVDWLQNHHKVTQQDIEGLLLIPPSSTIYRPKPTSTIINDHGPTARFIVKNDGVYYNDDDTMRWICSKLEIKALVRDKLSENWGRLLEFTDADADIHLWAMPMEMLKGSSEELRGELLRLGLEIASGLRTRHLLAEYITTTKTEARARCVSRTGWHPPVFVFPDSTIGHTNEMVIYQSESPTTPHGNFGQSCDCKQSVV